MGTDSSPLLNSQQPQHIIQQQQSVKMKVTLAVMLCAAVFVVSEAVFRVPGPCEDAAGNSFNTDDTVSANTIPGLEGYEDCVTCSCGGDAWYCDPCCGRPGCVGK